MFSQSGSSKKRSFFIEGLNADKRDSGDEVTSSHAIEAPAKKSKEEVDDLSLWLTTLTEVICNNDDPGQILELISNLQQLQTEKKVSSEGIVQWLSKRNQQSYSMMHTICKTASPFIIKAILALVDEQALARLLKQPLFLPNQQQACLALHLLMQNAKLHGIECPPDLREELITLFEKKTINFNPQHMERELTWLQLHQRFPQANYSQTFTENLNMAWRALVQTRRYVSYVGNHVSMNSKSPLEHYTAQAKLSFARSLSSHIFDDSSDFIKFNRTKDHHHFELLKIALITAHQSTGNCEEQSYFVCRELLKMHYTGNIEIVNITPGDHALVIIGEGPDRMVIDAWANDIYPFAQAAERMQDYTSYQKKQKPCYFITYPVDPSIQSMVSLVKFSLNHFKQFAESINATAHSSAELIEVEMLDCLKNKYQHFVIKHLKLHPNEIELTSINSVAVSIEDHQFKIIVNPDDATSKTLLMSYITFMDYAAQQIYEDVLALQKDAVMNYFNNPPHEARGGSADEIIGDLVIFHKGIIEVKRVNRLTQQTVTREDTMYVSMNFINEVYKKELQRLLAQDGDKVLALLQTHHHKNQPIRIEVAAAGYNVFFKDTSEIRTISYKDFQDFANKAKAKISLHPMQA